MNPLQVDPTRLVTVRRQFLADFMRRVRRLKDAVNSKVAVEDVFGLRPAVLGLSANTAWAFESDPRKLELFKAWLQEQLDNEFLSLDPITGEIWAGKYLRTAYNTAVRRSFNEVKGTVATSVDVFAGMEAQFIESVFRAGIPETQLQKLFVLAFHNLKGITDDMSLKMSQVLATGLAARTKPKQLAKQLHESIGVSIKRARLMVRTELTRSHSDGQLDAFQALGVEELNLKVEWTTSGAPCPVCAAAAGTVYTIEQARGVIPAHPGCVCAWSPIIVDVRGRKRGNNVSLKRALLRSV